MENALSFFVKQKCKQLKLTQPELAERTGVGLRFIGELEHGKQTLRLDKVNQVLALFGSEIGVIRKSELWDKQKYFTKINWQGLSQKMMKDIFFVYDYQYLESSNPKPVSLTLPLQKTAYESKILFPFFDGLIPEGWLLNIAIDNWKINPRDRFGLLLSLCKDCIGCVSIIAKDNK